jgi:hypothetical protein
MTGFSPYVLFRRGTLGLAALADTIPARTWALVAEAAALAEARVPLRATIEDELHRVIPELPAEHRRTLLRLRRDVHNDRPSRLCTVEILPAGCRAAVAEWARSCESGERLLAQATAAFGEELEAARKTLADVALGEDFRRGVQLSGVDVYREVLAYANNPFDSGRKPSRRRRVESTITSFAYRVVFKPSPFGSFTEVGAQPWTEGETVAASRVGRARLSIGLLAWLAQRLRGIDRSDELMRVRLNNSIIARGDTVTFVRRPIEGTDDGFAADRVVTAKNTGLVQLLTAELGEHDLTERQLYDRLVAAGLSRADAVRTVDKLVTIGLCHRGLGLPDQTVGGAGEIAALLRGLDTDQAARGAALFDRLQGVEDEYAVATAVRRGELLAESHGLIRELTELCGCPPPPEEALTAVMYEDVGTRARAATWRPSILEANRAGVALFQRLVPVLDDATIERLGLYRFHTERFGTGDVPLVDVFAAFAELAPDAAGRIMSGTGDEACDHVRELRAELFDIVLDHPTVDGELTLDQRRLGAFADRLPGYVLPWRSAAYRVQVAGHRAVVNGVTTGHGVFYSRFCDLLEPDGPGWSLRASVREHIAATNPRQTDITSTLGLNFNLHPELAPLELVYPGSVARTAGGLTIADLLVRPDPVRRGLNLVSTRDDRPISLVPLNFLFPAAAPPLYRFLCAFAPTRTYRGGLWDQVDRAGVPIPAERPRVLLGDLVLDRRAWRFDLSELPPMDGLERQELPAMLAFDAWRRAAGVPRHTFFRLVPRTARAAHARDLLAETRDWALAARSARLHKPHYLDSHHPFLLSVLAKQVSGGTDAAVLFQECLPARNTYLGTDGPASAEEFFVEFTLEGEDVNG